MQRNQRNQEEVTGIKNRLNTTVQKFSNEIEVGTPANYFARLSNNVTVTKEDGMVAVSYKDQYKTWINPYTFDIMEDFEKSILTEFAMKPYKDPGNGLNRIFSVYGHEPDADCERCIQTGLSDLLKGS